jgi:hypothetical protein
VQAPVIIYRVLYIMTHYVKKNEWKTAVPPPPPSLRPLRRTAGRAQTPPISRGLQNDLHDLIKTIDRIPKKLDKEAVRVISESAKRYRIGDGKLKPYGDFMAPFPTPGGDNSHLYKYDSALREAADNLDYVESQMAVIQQHIDVARQSLVLIKNTIYDTARAGQMDYTMRDRARHEVERQMEKEGVTLDDLDSPERQLMTIGGANKTRRHKQKRTARNR